MSTATANKGLEAARVSAREQMLLKTIDFLSGLSGLDPESAARSICNHLQGISGADRVSLIVPESGIVAISGVEEIDPNATVVPAFMRLAGSLASRGSAIWCGFGPDGVKAYESGKQGEILPSADVPEGQLESAIRDYQAMSASSLIGLLPIFCQNELIGCVVVEQFKSVAPKAFLGEKVDLTLSQVSGRLAEALQHSQVPLVAAQKKLASTKGKAKGYGGILRLAIFLCFAIAPFFIKLDLTMEGEGTLDPEYRVEAFHGYTAGLAEVTHVYVKHGQRVKAGQPLFQLSSKEVDRQISDVQAVMASKQGEAQELRTTLWTDRGEMTENVKARNVARIESLRIELESRANELASLTALKSSLTVRAKIDGIVTKPKDFNDYIGKSFGPKDALATIVQPEKSWVVSLWVTENQMTHIREAIERDGLHLPVTYYLGTDPKSHYQGQIREVDSVMEVRPNERDKTARILIKVAVDKEGLKYPEAGASVRARVSCGECNLYYYSLWRVMNWFSEMTF